MPDDNRLDLSGDLESLLQDVEAATDEVKQRKARIAAEDAKDVGREKSRKTQMMLIAIGAVAVLLISYWIVFARPNAGQGGAVSTVTTLGTPTAGTPIGNPGATHSTTNATPRSGNAGAGQGSQTVEQPPDEYEQPSGDGGM